MATYRYWDVRRAVYEECSNNPIKKYRSFAEMKRLFKLSYWLLLIGMIICLIVCIVLLFFFPNTLYWLIPVCCAFAFGIIGERFGSKMYNPAERKREISENSANLEKHIEFVKSILKDHGIVTKDQRETLKKECEKQLVLHNSGYKSVSSKVFDMLVGVPLGAFISALIYKSESADIVVDQLFVVIVLGLMAVGVANLFKKITYYSDGLFKDRYLLDVLNELDYLSE